MRSVTYIRLKRGLRKVVQLQVLINYDWYRKEYGKTCWLGQGLTSSGRSRVLGGSSVLGGHYGSISRHAGHEPHDQENKATIATFFAKTKQNSVAQQPMKAKAYCAHLSFRDFGHGGV
ncbi:hypothetical protein TNCV_1288381 [Trichonephila clavipes]|nr:hypothetical protein TNCV_1288381 [Trichonephila clavipes]